ncbi:MAG: hypothetical protein KME10_02580 [Plectolyngbya sp. WJT66-NPBG17]|jgi:hypothetical protein|nr:hypothetical protein [Plectolyngbya sp. WJT66-NPBG17]MBW4524068.1 hypothetical protein [Phormidium tanganyikae FI6-MK23]
MASPTRLTGLDLVDCARANAKQGIETAANLCGYGSDLEGFRSQLKQACEHMRIEFHELGDLIKDQPVALSLDGVTVEPVPPEEL